MDPQPHMSLLLTNDDGIDAPGLAALCSVVQPGGPITIVAPQVEQSGVAHRVTDKHPITVQSRDGRRFAVDGMSKPRPAGYIAANTASGTDGLDAMSMSVS